MKGLVFAPAVAPVPGYAATSCRLAGDAQSALIAPDGFALWAVRGSLAPGAALQWDGDHGDEGLYVIDGHLAVDGREAPARGAVIVEAGAPARVAAGPDGATVVHFGPHDPEPPAAGRYGPPARSPRGVHVVGPGGVYAAVQPGRETRMFADSTCPTCRITLFFTSREQEYVSARHSHSADEILYLLAGEVRFGNRRLGPGDAAAIRADHRYAFRSGDAGFAFLNYRRDASEQTSEGGPPRLEGGQARGLDLVNDLR